MALDKTSPNHYLGAKGNKSKPKKIKVKGKPTPNCEVVVESLDKGNPVWEPRFYDESTDYVYAYHKGYLWPQRKPKDYHNFCLVRVVGTDKEDLAGMVWQEFMKYKDLNKVSKDEKF